MKYIIFGLGNVGETYRFTRHNIGFEVVEALASDANSTFKTDRYSEMAEFNLKGRKVILIKPTTFMNLSGKAVNYWMAKENVSVQNILIVVDDLALPFGSIRLKEKGSDGGHNGLANITEILGNNLYPRLRFGIGNDFSKGRQVDFVLSRWNEEEQKLLPERIDKMKEAVKSFVFIGLERTMNYFNGK